tara:strand:- start:1013 stop:1750 length:738 start_codon:yes stop_codon:yes gene_type:complete
MKLIQISDCHLFESPELSAYGDINPAESLSAVLVDAVEQQPDGLLFTGDISGDDSGASYQLFLSLLNQWGGEIPWRVIPGNHDNNPYFDQVLKANWLRADTPWILKGKYIHGLDTRLEETLGVIDEKQLANVAATITTAPEAGHLLAIHHHPVATGSWMDNHALQNTAALTRWLSKHPIKAVLHGHIHAETQAQLSDIPVFGVPSSCWQWQLSAKFGLASEKPGFRVIEWAENGTFTSRIHRITQ